MKKLIVILIIVMLLMIMPLTYGCLPGNSVVSASSAENQLPIAYIDSISPAKVAKGQKVIFEGHGTAVEEGNIVAYSWRSNKDGDLSSLAQFESAKLSQGKHTIYFKVQDNSGAWSTEVRKAIEITSNTKTSSTATSTTTASVINPTFRVTQITDMSGTPSGVYSIPFTMNFSGSIITDGPGIVTYFWERSDGVMSATKSKEFYGAYAQTVSYSWKVSDPGNYWVRLHTLIPNEMVSIKFSLLITRQSSLVTSVVSTYGYVSCNYECPANLQFSAAITTDGPCTVKYVWIRSDGTTNTAKSIVFSEADTKTVDYTWKVTESGKYWARLCTIEPNTMDATNYKTLIVECE